MRILIILVLSLVLVPSAFAAEVVPKSQLSLRGRVVAEQIMDLRDQRCFETLQSCQSSLSRLALSFRPIPEQEQALNQRIKELENLNVYYLKMIGCLKQEERLKKEDCLESIAKK